MTVVSTAAGRARGVAANGVHTFRAIPYAAPMSGAARFQAPAPAPRWDGVRDATRPGPTAPAARRDFGGVDLRPVLGSGWVPGADYLSVTISTPDPATRGLPVLVFFHGGGFTAGTGQTELYAGDTFARDGVVLVTVQYRLGVAGWLRLPDAPANRGLLDALAALHWVAENIAAFGGDPGNVTVAGQSAGAMLVSALLVSPGAAGLFRRAISQSGSGECAFPVEKADLITRATADVLGVAPTAAGLSELPDERLVAAPTAMPPAAIAGFRDTSLGSSAFKPVLDEQTLPAQPASGNPARVSLLIGTNADEANLYSANLDDAALQAAAARRFPDPAAALARARAQLPGASPAELAARLMTEAYEASNRRLADAHSRAGNPTHVYEFAWPPPGPDHPLGACHCAELPFVFDHTALPGLYGQSGLLGAGRPDPALAARTHAAWVGYATNGDPGWPPHQPDAPAIMHLAEDWYLKT
ncbi:carboxylesterase/lipase family protein [Amycolatopsis orientalis]|uniref:carboxylesterase/lipase family protein n=1 Tax=Amycolatopsis orientalis TaxID=31958 RepID=UPI0003A7006F|nr:carboxylesterase family protein [Amycolatopsis orientalis]